MPPADISFPTLTDLIPFSNQTILDTELSFRNAIGRYFLLDQAASSLIVDMAALSPDQLLLRTSQVSSMQQDLVRQDDQLISILMLAGPEILDADFIKAYQQILAKVIMSCEQIREQMTEIKKNAERLDNPQKS